MSIWFDFMGERVSVKERERGRDMERYGGIYRDIKRYRECV